MGKASCDSLGDYVIIFPKQTMSNSNGSSGSLSGYTEIKKQISELKELIEDITIAMEDIDGKIEKAKQDVTNKIMGVGNPKYTTFTDVSAQIDKLNNSLQSQKETTDALKSLIGDSNSGLTRKINDTKEELEDLENNVCYIKRA